MKKLLIFVLVLGMASMALAVPVFRVDPCDAKDHYMPSEVITIQLYDEGTVTGVNIEAINAFICLGGVRVGPAGGTAYEPQLFNAELGATQPGALNSNGQLVEYMYASDIAAPWATGVLYSFEYHIPDLPASTLICIESFDDGGVYYYPAAVSYLGGGTFEGTIEMECIHIVPEPATIALLGLGGLLLRRKK